MTCGVSFKFGSKYTIPTTAVGFGTFFSLELVSSDLVYSHMTPHFVQTVTSGEAGLATFLVNQQRHV